MDALGDRGSWGRLGLRTRLSKQGSLELGRNEFFMDMSSMTKVRRTPFDLIALLWDLGAVHGGLLSRKDPDSAQDNMGNRAWDVQRKPALPGRCRHAAGPSLSLYRR